MNEPCAICDKPLINTRQKEVGMCRDCEIHTHGCSTGDCPHELAVECLQALADLKREQDEGNKSE